MTYCKDGGKLAVNLAGNPERRLDCAVLSCFNLLLPVERDPRMRVELEPPMRVEPCQPLPNRVGCRYVPPNPYITSCQNKDKTLIRGPARRREVCGAVPSLLARRGSRGADADQPVRSRSIRSSKPPW